MTHGPAGKEGRSTCDHTDQRRFAELLAAYLGDRDLLLVTEENGPVAGGAMGLASSGPDVTSRILAVAAGQAQNET
jgi:hypothetical protein